MEDDFLIDDDELDEGDYYAPVANEDDELDSESFESEEDFGPKKRRSKKGYEGELTPTEVSYILLYDEITKGKEKEDLVNSLISANPRHTSSMTRSNVAKEVLNTQGHNRMRNKVYTAETSLTGRDIDEDYLGNDDSQFNEEISREFKEIINRFIDYLANRDLSKDTINSRKRKQRHIPAFIIFLFSSGNYDFILNCPTMPPEYDKQINSALREIEQEKYKIVEALAARYDEAGRPEVGERVRKMKLQWFNKEPAEIKTAPDYRDLKLTQDDVNIYREYRNKFTNVSKSITQDVISGLIKVVLDKDSGIYEELKDKTRSTAIEDVKAVFREWASENSSDSELAKRLIYKDVN